MTSDPTFCAAKRAAAALLAAIAGVAMLAIVTASSARADEGQRREVPDYDSRAEPGDDAVDALLWIPRILTGPLYLVSEYVIRVPLGAAITAIEQNEVVQFLLSSLEFGPERQFTLLVTAFYDFGFLPSVGVYAAWRAFLVEGNRISLHAATWGVDWLSLTIADRARIGDTTLYARGGYIRRPDYLLGTTAFFSGPSREVRYASESIEGEVGYLLEPGGRSYFGASVYGRWARFGDTTFGDQPSIVEHASETGQALPPGFTDGYAVVSLRARGALDNRDSTGVPSAGARMAAHAELVRSVEGLQGSTWFLVGGQLLGATDILGARRTLSLAVDVSTILAVRSAIVPFDLMPDAGGNGPMPGFWPGHLRGGSAVAVTLAYDWPVWLFLNARLYVAAGNAFAQAFDGFALERLRLSFGFALRPISGGEHPFELGVGAGTDPFEDGASVSTFRLFVGTRNDL